ncbi:hypothetical protein [Halostella pelagica]|uniref:hypothetical protein n=1 Tax=Halostella pelagica TaxID=2583824 RepID=UPI0010819F76|nr:hypothetical protein [Halostella pelagica]
MRRAALLTLAVLLAVTAGVAAPVAAQENTTTTTGGDDAVNASDIDTSQIAGELGTVTVHEVEFADNGLVKITVTAERHSGPIAVTDSGAVDIGSNERASVPFEVYRPSEGQHVLRFHLSSDDALITIQEGGEMMAASGERGTVDVMAASPTVDVVRWSAIGGGIGVLVATGLAAGFLRRKHQNTYKELLSEERIRVEEDPVDGVLGKAKRFFTRHKYALLTAAAIVGYLVAVRLGMLPSIGAVWGDMTDSQRVVTTAAGAMTVIGFLPAYAIVTRVWEPAKEFVIDIDARDVLDPSLGSNGGLALDADDIEDVADELQEKEEMDVVGVYSGSPERVRKMRVDGKKAEVETPGGKGHLVEEFDAKRNAARGTWPGTANDVELISERSKIDGNREVLRDESRMLRTLIGALPAIATASDTDAMRSVDKEIRELATVNSDPIDSLLNRAAQDTRFEGMYTDDDGDEDEEESGLEQVVNGLNPGSDDGEDDENEGDEQ